MPKIMIHNLGPIRECNMELDKFCVLTGPQASGKSTVAKAIFYFRTIKDDCIMLYKKNLPENDREMSFRQIMQKYLRGKFMQMFGSSWGMNMDMLLRYEYGEETFIQIELKESRYVGSPNYIYFTFSDNISALLSRLNSDFLDNEILEQEIKAVFSDSREIVYIPAGRSMITLLTSQLNYILSIMDDMQKKSIDYCTQNYMERILRLKPLFSEGIRAMYFNKMTMSAEPMQKEILSSMIEHIDDILKGEYQYMGGEERLVLGQNQYVKLNYTSSGQQEVVWILNLLYYFVLENKEVYLILEEPESHLYPAAQSAVAEMMGLFLKAGNQMLLTTHSPYILGAVNNLMYADKVATKALNEVNAIIPELMRIDGTQSAAFYVSSGVLKDILDDEISMIQNSVIDDISSDINQQSNMLTEIDLQN